MSGRAALSTVAISLSTVLIQLVHTRILAFLFWNHIVYLVVYVALLGYAIAGSVSALLPTDVRSSPRLVAASLFAFAVSNVGAVPLLARLASRNEMLFTLDQWAPAAVVGAYGLLVLPYACLGLALVAIFGANREAFPTLYALDLVAAGAGVVLCVALLEPLGAVRLLGSASVLCLAVACSWIRVRPRELAFATVAVVAVGSLLFAADRVELRPAKDKILGILTDPRANPGTTIEATRWNIVGRVDVVRADDPRGMTFHGKHLAQGDRIITYDGDASTVLATGTASGSPPSVWEIAPPPERVLVIGVGGGKDLELAAELGATSIDGVEVNRTTIDLMRGPYARASNDLYTRAGTHVHAGDGRSYAARTTERYDRVIMTGIDSFTASSSGANMMVEDYLYTVEAFQDFLRVLRPGGLLSIRRPSTLEHPTQDIRVVATALRAFADLGVPDGERHVLVPASGLVWVFRDPVPDAAIAAMLGRLRATGETVLFPARLASRDGPLPYHEAFMSLAEASAAGAERAWLDAYPADVSPVYDDRPFFFQLYRFRDAVTDLFEGTSEAIGWGSMPYRTLALTLAQAFVMVAGFVLGPLIVWRRSGIRVPRSGALATYFASLGLGYILLELALMQRFAILLGDPALSLSVVLGAMLVGSGVGSLAIGRLAPRREPYLKGALAFLVWWSLLLLMLEPIATRHALAAPLATRVLVVVAACAPLSVVLGTFLPTGVRMIEDEAESFLPWAWGINAGFTVLGSVLAIIVALAAGFSAVLACGAFCYVVGVSTMLRATAVARG